ncbi:hypothetical protein [Planococcus sp. ISL-109]|uniref:hypothetical protein n=1 Tax=Planococcus sp. ISL-109 TaxID=2819166 RepID=UPI001BEBA76F|nr:hypothetical protein [Planococcus sp. ISL-109]MBT2582341.1 hypothetical protein [Planococcus sp. ISL-109]
MEPLIIMVIIMAISALFSKNKKPDGNQPAKRQQVPGASQTSQTPQAPQGGQRKFKRIEDYAKEIYSEMQAQMQEDPKRAEQARQVKEQAERVKSRAIEEVDKRTKSPSPGRQAKQPTTRPGRLSAHKEEALQPAVHQTVKDELLPLKDEDVLKGIIMAEILLPPKAKR